MKYEACRVFYLLISRNDFNKVNNTGARVYHMTLNLL